MSDVLDEMRSDGVPPNYDTFRLIIQCASHVSPEAYGCLMPRP